MLGCHAKRFTLAAGMLATGLLLLVLLLVATGLGCVPQPVGMMYRNCSSAAAMYLLHGLGDTRRTLEVPGSAPAGLLLVVCACCWGCGRDWQASTAPAAPS